MLLRRKRNLNVEDIEKEIEQWKSQCKKQVTIIVFPGEVQYLLQHGYDIVPLYFAIKYSTIKDIARCPNFLKTKYNKKKNKVYRLKKKDRILLDNVGIEYEALGVIVNLW